MKTDKFILTVIAFVFIGCCLFGQVQMEGDRVRGDKVTFRGSDVVLPILSIQTQNWNTTFCPEDPEIDWNNVYDGAFGDKDVNKLRTIPYSNNSASGNPFLDNHTFWFAFGGGGQSFCVDDNDASAVFTDNFWNVGSLHLTNMYIGPSLTTIWVDFLTQCENCSGFGEGGKGVWHKWEEEFDPSELAAANAYPGGTFGASITYEATVLCEIFEVYGCQSGESD